MAKIIKFNKPANDSGNGGSKSGPPKINLPSEIREYPDEANRQIVHFQHNIHRADWEDTDYEGEEPKQDTKARDAFHKAHGLRMLPNNIANRDVKTTAHHLDYYHHHYPDIAKRMNMRPFTMEVSAEVEAKEQSYRREREGQQAGENIKAGLPKDHNPHFDIKKGDDGETYVRPKGDMASFFDDIKTSLNKSRSKDVGNFAHEHPHLKGQPHNNVYDRYHDWQGFKNTLVRPMEPKEFKKHWEKQGHHKQAGSISSLDNRLLSTSSKKSKVKLGDYPEDPAKKIPKSHRLPFNKEEWIKEDYQVRRKNSGAYVIVDTRTGEEHHTGYLNIKAARKKKKQLEKGGVPKRLKESEVAANHTGDGVANPEPPFYGKTTRGINNKRIPKKPSHGKILVVKRRTPI